MGGEISQQVLIALIKSLADSRSMNRKAIKRALDNIDTKWYQSNSLDICLEIFIEILSSDDVYEIRRVLYALQDIASHGNKCIEPIMKAFSNSEKNNDQELLQMMSWTLDKLDKDWRKREITQEAIKKLRQHLLSSNVKARYGAVCALGEIGNIAEIASG